MYKKTMIYILIVTSQSFANFMSNFKSRPHGIEYISSDEIDHRHCPEALEVRYNKTDRILDNEYLDGLCKNFAGVVKLKISGTFNALSDSLLTKLPRLEEFQATEMMKLTEVNVATGNLKLLDFSNDNLQKAYIDLMDDLLHLNLSRNHLQDENITITSSRPNLDLKLRVLDLSYNQISRIDGIIPIWNLKKYILNNNNISYIKPGILQRYPSLVTLNLAKNKIKELPTGMFTGLIHLVNLDLSDNVLNHAHVKIINSLRSLEFLDLGGNHIDNFNYDDMDHHLEVLRINEDNLYVHGKRVAVPKKLIINTSTISESTTTPITTMK